MRMRRAALTTAFIAGLASAATADQPNQLTRTLYVRGFSPFGKPAAEGNDPTGSNSGG